MTRLLAVIALGTGIALGTLLLGSQVHAGAGYDGWSDICNWVPEICGCPDWNC